MASMSTPNPCHEYKFRWEIENFSTTPKKFEGPLFSPIPEKKETFCFEIDFLEKDPTDKTSRILVYLKSLEDYDKSICLESRITLRNKDSSFSLFELKTVEVKGNNVLLMDQTVGTSCKENAMCDLNLRKSILIIEGSLKFYAYAMTVKAENMETLSEVLDELVNDLRNLYQGSFPCDVTFSVGESSLSAHQSILASRSPVFAKMFAVDMQERNSSNVVIEDVKFCVFDCFLKFLYTGVLDDKTWDTVFSLYSLADKYQVISLKKTCSQILGDSLTVNVACSALLLSDLHGDDELKKKVSYFLAYNLDVLRTKEWAEIVVSKPQLVENIMSIIKWYSSLRFITL